jgi:hypothetical protein
LTSQIFANIYLNEFDRYVRHTIKPLGYVRYGDDFVLFVSSKIEAQDAQKSASEWLLSALHLRVHSNNNVIKPATSGLYFLGHIIYSVSPLSVDLKMRCKIEMTICLRNAASYQAMKLPRRFASKMPWLLLNRIDSDHI